jgi:hypothetical protein
VYLAINDIGGGLGLFGTRGLFLICFWLSLEKECEPVKEKFLQTSPFFGGRFEGIYIIKLQPYS